MSESKNVAVDILRAEAARREVLIAELRSEADALNAAAADLETYRHIEAFSSADTDEGRGEPDDETEYLTSSPVNADRLYSSLSEVPKPQPPRDRAFGPRVQHLSPADMPRPS